MSLTRIRIVIILRKILHLHQLHHLNQVNSKRSLRFRFFYLYIYWEIKKLTWEDYSGLPDVDDPAIAHTKWKIGYNYTLKLGTDDSEFLIEVDVWCKVDSSSWVKTKFVELLNHE